MKIEYFKWWSAHLSQEIELKVYGHAGKPAMVFPAMCGRFYEYEDFGMVGACERFIEDGRIQLYTVDSVDSQAWANWAAHPADRGRRADDYHAYLTEEVDSFIKQNSSWEGKFLATGCSMGAYQAVNIFFRRPDLFDAVIGLSGIYRLNMFIGDYMDERAYFHSPLTYLPNLDDAWYLDQYRHSQIIICSGQGAWEDRMVEDALAMKAILDAKNIPCRIDLWGHDVNHDWPWWRKMMPYFLGHLGLYEE